MANSALNGVVKNYPLHIRQLERLSNGEGCNYCVTDVRGKQYVLKVYLRAEAERVAFITTILTFLAQTHLPVHFPVPVQNIQGQCFTVQAEHVLVVLHWIAGHTQLRITPPMAEELGSVVGGLDEQLAEFYHGHALDYSKYQDSLWNVTNIQRLAGDLEHLRGRLGDVYGIIKETMAHFVSASSSWSQTLPWSVIHNDINLGNVLYDAHMQLVGIIDFGEICHTYRVCEVGVALAYVLQTSQKDYLQAGEYFVRGYTQSCTLSVAEQSVLLLVVKLRLCITIIYNTMQQYGGQALTVSQARFIRNTSALLTRLAKTTASEFQEQMFAGNG